MAFPGTHHSRLHGINGGKLWKPFCSPLSQTLGREAHWDWVTSESHRDTATQVTKYQNPSHVYSAWSSDKSEANPPWLTALEGFKSTWLAKMRRDAEISVQVRSSQLGPAKGRVAWMVTVAMGQWHFHWDLASQQHLCFCSTHRPFPTLPGNDLWNIFIPCRQHPGPNFSEEFGVVGCSAKGGQCHNKPTACQVNKLPMVSSQRNKLHCRNEM